jgi:hypothetical protein
LGGLSGTAEAPSVLYRHGSAPIKVAQSYLAALAADWDGSLETPRDHARRPARLTDDPVPDASVEDGDTVHMAYDADLAQRLRDVVAGEAELTEKRLFGGLAFLIHGHLVVTASSQGGLLLRIDPADSEALVDGTHVRRSACAGVRWTAGCTSMPARSTPKTTFAAG